MDCIVDAVNKIIDNDIKTLPNRDAEMSYFGFPKKSDVKAFLTRGAKFY